MRLTTTRKSVCVALAMMMLVPCGSAFASSAPAVEKNVVSASELYGAMSERTDAEAASRAGIQKLLARADVRRVAVNAGIDLDRAKSAVSVLSGESLQVAANQAQRVTEALAGGSGTIVVTSTAVIIGLLVLIVLIVA